MIYTSQAAHNEDWTAVMQKDWTAVMQKYNKQINPQRTTGKYQRRTTELQSEQYVSNS